MAMAGEHRLAITFSARHRRHCHHGPRGGTARIRDGAAALRLVPSQSASTSVLTCECGRSSWGAQARRRAVALLVALSLSLSLSPLIARSRPIFDY
jgi:hypothetical protein